MKISNRSAYFPIAAGCFPFLGMTGHINKRETEVNTCSNEYRGSVAVIICRPSPTNNKPPWVFPN